MLASWAAACSSSRVRGWYQKLEAEMPNLKPVQPYEDALEILPLRIKCTTLACSHSESQERTNSRFT